MTNNTDNVTSMQGPWYAMIKYDQRPEIFWNPFQYHDRMNWRPIFFWEPQNFPTPAFFITPVSIYKYKVNTLWS